MNAKALILFGLLAASSVAEARPSIYFGISDGGYYGNRSPYYDNYYAPPRYYGYRNYYYYDRPRAYYGVRIGGGRHHNRHHRRHHSRHW